MPPVRRPILHPLRAPNPALIIEPELYQGVAFYDVEMERIREELEKDLQAQREELEAERQALKFMYAQCHLEWPPTCVVIAQQSSHAMCIRAQTFPQANGS